MPKKVEGKEEVPGQELINAWNDIIGLIIEAEKKWRKYQELYKQSLGIIHLMHPEDQRIFHRQSHRQIFEFFIEDLGRDVHFGLSNLLTGRNS